MRLPYFRAVLVRINPENPSIADLLRVVEVLRQGGVIIYPTDTVYGLGCDITNKKSVERVAAIKGEKPEKANLSIVCTDLSHLSDYARRVDNATFKLMKRCLPGPFTFVLEAGGKVPAIFTNKKKTIGIRVPNHKIPRELVRLLENPIVTTSLHSSDTLLEYPTDPDYIYECFGIEVDCVVSGGHGNLYPSTVVDCTGSEPVVVREGLGDAALVWG